MDLGYRQSTRSPSSSGPVGHTQGLIDFGSNGAMQELLAQPTAPRSRVEAGPGYATRSSTGEMPDWAAPLSEAAALGATATPPPQLDTLLASLAVQSPTLASAIGVAKTAGYTFAYGAPGAGTCTISDPKIMRVQVDPQEASSPRLAATLAHELGHITDVPPGYEFDASMDRDRYITRNTIEDLEQEADATLTELEVRDEILAAGGADPGITGATAVEKIRLWEEHVAGRLSRPNLVHEIVMLFARVEQPSTDPSAKTYWYLYAPTHAAAWDANNPGDQGKPLPSPP